MTEFAEHGERFMILNSDGTPTGEIGIFNKEAFHDFDEQNDMVWEVQVEGTDTYPQKAERFLKRIERTE